MDPIHPTLAPELPATQEAPDLELLVHEQHGSGGWGFDLHLKARDPELDLNYLGVGTIALRTEPGEYFRRQIAEIWKDRPRTAEEWASFANLLRGKGAYLSETILPAELRRRLSELRGQVRSLLIQSDDPWIPWEILCVPATPGGEDADGPFLCEAFALTRWLRGTRQRRWLPIERMAVVVPRDSGLPQAEGELTDLLAFAEEERRRVERISARLADLHAAFCQGEYDGWHFTGHGLHRASAPDLSSICLEQGEELTPDRLSGEAKNLGKKRPLVFLNACSSGKTGVSLTGIGGLVPHFLRAGAGGCIGTLWPVDDRPARAFAQAFYSAFIAGASIAEAVFSARQAIRSDGNPTWLAYTVFAHPLAVCAPPPAGALPSRPGPAEDSSMPPVSAPPPAPVAKPPRWQRRRVAAGIAVFLLIFSTAGYLIEIVSRSESPDKNFAPAAQAPGTAEPQGAEQKLRQTPPAGAATPPPETARSTAVAPQGPSTGTARGISFKIDAGSGFSKSTFRRALENAAAPLAGMGISGWALELDVDAPSITSQDQDGLSLTSCRLTAYGHAHRQGISLDLGPLHAVNSQFDRSIACEGATQALAEAAVRQLVSSLRKGAT